MNSKFNYFGLVGLLVSLFAAPALATDLTPAGSTPTELGGEASVVRQLIKFVDCGETVLTTNSQHNLFDIPARTYVLGVTATVLTPEGGTLTFDLGDGTDTDGFIDGANGNATAGTVVGSGLGFGTQRSGFVDVFDAAVAASQSAAAWGIESNVDVGGGMKGIIMPFPYSVTGISVISDTAATTGSLTADATIDATVTGLQAVISSGETEESTTQAAGVDVGAADTLLGAKVTTSSTWAQTSADVAVRVFYEGYTTYAYSHGKYYASADTIDLTFATGANPDKAQILFKVYAIQF